MADCLPSLLTHTLFVYSHVVDVEHPVSYDRHMLIQVEWYCDDSYSYIYAWTIAGADTTRLLFGDMDNCGVEGLVSVSYVQVSEGTYRPRPPKHVPVRPSVHAHALRSNPRRSHCVPLDCSQVRQQRTLTISSASQSLYGSHYRSLPPSTCPAEVRRASCSLVVPRAVSCIRAQGRAFST